jgi:hypothetical protein
MESGLGSGDAGLRKLDSDLCPGGLELGFCAFQRRLADVILLEQLLLALVFPGCQIERCTRGLDLGVTGGSVLVGRPGIDA